MSAFDNATLMITGGTGSFGSTVLKHFMDSDLKEIRIFSRDEKKQDDMRHELQAKHPEHAKKVKFYIGDVRNPQSVRDAMPGVDYIFHAAALKQVPSCEFFPMEAVRTNVIGTDNVLHAAIDAGVKRVVCLSTDKAAYGAYEFAAQDGSEAVVFALGQAMQYFRPLARIRLRGLNPNALYQVNGEGNWSGRALMEIGIEPDLRGDFDSSKFHITLANR